MTSVSVEQAARFQVLVSRPAIGPVGHPGHGAVGLVVLGVRGVPVVRAGAAGEDLDEADAALDQPPGDQAVGGEPPGDRVVQPVEPRVAAVSRAQVHRLGHGAPACGTPARSEAIRGERSSARAAPRRQVLAG